MTHKGWCVVKHQTNKKYNNVAKGIRLLDKKKHFLFMQEKIMQVRAFERCNLLKEQFKR